jgi:carboxypeptidase C (cathepsin A)
MSEEPKPQEKSSAQPEYQPPAGAEASATWTGAGISLPYTASAGWIVLRKKERPAAEIFSVSYVAQGDGERPVTFIFNGGPGASSAYLHMGAAGPSRVAFPDDGSLPRMPPRLVANEESWLAFSDLVFVDPVGTGFSRVVEAADPPGDGAAKKHDDDANGGEGNGGEGKGGEGKGAEYFGYKRDLESLSEFMARWLSARGRWGSAVFIAGESYGGYRVGRLVRMLQETTGIGLSGAILISPALEFGPLAPTDYDIEGWVDRLPTMALAAMFHGRSRAFAAGTPPEEVVREAEAFATGEYAALLMRGVSMPEAERERIFGHLSELIGLPAELIARAEGRVDIGVFARELLRAERKVLGLYDATITTTDPFPNREPFSGPDPTLMGIAPAYTTAINRQLRSEIGVQTEREYMLLSEDVNEAWRNDAPEHFFVPPAGATDDLRYGLSLNPHMKAFICHGRYDLITPYYETDRLRNLMRLDAETAARLTVRHFDGGHMFYAWEASRREFTEAIRAFMADALAG